MRVRLSKNAEKDILRIPLPIQNKLLLWVQSVETVGLQRTRLIKGFHDEPLKGKRLGQRSIRLNRAYRAIYREKLDHSIEFVLIEEVNKHEY